MARLEGISPKTADWETRSALLLSGMSALIFIAGCASSRNAKQRILGVAAGILLTGINEYNNWDYPIYCKKKWVRHVLAYFTVPVYNIGSSLYLLSNAMNPVPNELRPGTHYMVLTIIAILNLDTIRLVRRRLS